MRGHQLVWKNSRCGKQTFMALFMISYMERLNYWGTKQAKLTATSNHLKPRSALHSWTPSNTLPQPETFLNHQKCFFILRPTRPSNITDWSGYTAGVLDPWSQKKKKTRKTILSLRNQVAINKPTQLQICCIANNTLASMHSMIPSFHNSARPERLGPQVLAEIKGAAQSFICLYSIKKGGFCF